MIKVKLTLAYDGSEYFGSQIQPDKITVESVLLEAFKTLNIDTNLEFSGRTDRGVHAFRQVVSCIIPKYFNNLLQLKNILNNILPSTILIRNIQLVSSKFHARFSAKKREYRYLFTNSCITPFNYKYITYINNNIDKKRIKEASELFVGTYDFKYFSKTGSAPKTTIREIYKIDLYQYNKIFILRFQANGYLRSQIRMITATIFAANQQKITLQDIKKQLNKTKKFNIKPADPNGLYLSKIYY
jgi:tRNA pseudouridine38-40 synthase